MLAICHCHSYRRNDRRPGLSAARFFTIGIRQSRLVRVAAEHAVDAAMSSLKSTGNNDEDFVRLMLPRHQAALDMAKTELLHGQDPQMRRLAQEIITDQQSEIELMQLWLRQHQPQNSQSGSSRPKAY